MNTLSVATNHSNTSQNLHSGFMSSAEIDALLVKLARGHLSTVQEEYADLKRVLRFASNGGR